MIDWSMEQRILTALKIGPLHCHQVGEAIGLDPFQARAWLETMREDKLIVRELDGRYSLGYGGYGPGPGEAA